MKISIIGTGYVGLVSGACLAAKGQDVVCVDINRDRVAALNRAEAPIFEAGLGELLANHVGKNLRATVDLPAAVRDSDITLIAVGTPFNGDQIDLTAVLAAATAVGAALKTKDAYHVVVVKSTVVPGTTDGPVLKALEAASGKSAGRDFGVAMNPEFLSEGEAVNDFLFPDRLVLGGIDSRSIDGLERLYEAFPGVPRVRTNTRTAEMIKYASNSLLALLISFSNEIGNLCTATGGIDAVDVMRGVHLSQYFRGRTAEDLPPITSFLKVGCGFGGSCLPKDVKALIASGRRAGASTRMLEATIQVNEGQPERVVELLRKHWRDLAGVRVAVLGLSFKPETSDVRESPAFPIMQQLLESRAVVTAYDPVAKSEAQHAFPDPRVGYCDTLEAALTDIQAVVIVTPWKEFRDVPQRLKARTPAVVFVDSRRAFDRHEIAQYEGIGA